MQISRLACLLPVVAAAGATSTLATDVQFHDPDGTLLIDIHVDVLTLDGGLRELVTLDPDGTGTFDVDLAAGGKGTFLVHGPDDAKYVPVDRVIPVELEGPLPIVVYAVLNHQCDEAIPIAPGTVTPGSTAGAPSDPLVAGTVCGTTISNPSAGRWYVVHGTGTVLRASTCEADGTGWANYDTKISVFCSGCEDPTCVGGNDDSPACPSPSFHSTLDFCTVPGETYLVYVHGFGAATGSFDLELTDLGTACTPEVACSLPPPPPPPLMGACCNCLARPFDCTVETEADCLALTNDLAAYQGNGSTCLVASGTTLSIEDPADASIPDGSLVGLTRELQVAGDLQITDLAVRLSIAHTWIGDLRISLTHPDGTTATIVDRPGVPDSTFGCSLDDYAGIVLDDEGTGGSVEDLCVASATSPPSYTPSEPLSSLLDRPPIGVWTLIVQDLVLTDPGRLESWSLTFDVGAPVCPNDSPGPPGGPDGESDIEDDSFFLLDTDRPPDDDGLLELAFPGPAS